MGRMDIQTSWGWGTSPWAIAASECNNDSPGYKGTISLRFPFSFSVSRFLFTSPSWERRAWNVACLLGRMPATFTMSLPFVILLVLPLSPALDRGEEVRKPLFLTVDLDRGEQEEVELSGGTKVKVKLVGVEETRDTLRSALRQARVNVEVNGQPVAVVSGNYRLPLTVAGVQI